MFQMESIKEVLEKKKTGTPPVPFNFGSQSPSAVMIVHSENRRRIDVCTSGKRLVNILLYATASLALFSWEPRSARSHDHSHRRTYAISESSLNVEISEQMREQVH